MKTGLWKKTSKAGANYIGGSIEIEGKKYSIAIFKNDDSKKTNIKSPDYTLKMDEIITNQESPKTSINDVFKDFGNIVETKSTDDDDFAF